MKEREFNLLIIQAVKRDADFLIKKYNDLKIIEWRNFRRAMLQVEGWDNPLVKINSFCAIVSATFWLLGHSQPLFKRAVLRCFEKNKVFEGSKIYPNFSQIFNEIDNAAKDMDLAGYEHKNVRDHLKFVIYSIIETKEILDCWHGFTIEGFFSQEDIILNVMDEDSDYVISTVITDIFRDLQRFYEKYPVYPPRLRTLIIVDECRRMFSLGDSNNKYNHNPNRAMISFVTSRRSAGIALIAITQEPESAPSWLTNNSAFVLGFPIGGVAREHVKQLLNLSDEQASFIDELPERGTCIFRDRRFNRRYLLQVPGDLEISPITVYETDQFMLPFIQKSHHELKEKESATKDIMHKIQLNAPKQKAYTERDLEKIRDIIYPDTLMALKIIQREPFTPRTELFKKTGLTMKKFDTSVNWLFNENFISSVSCKTSKTRSSIFYPITEKGHDLLNTPRSQRKPSPKLFKHTYYCEKVKGWLEKQGLEAIREYIHKGASSFIIKTKDGNKIEVPQRIDVFSIEDGKKIGYEITLSLQNLNINICKCITKMEVDHLYIVCEDNAGIKRAKQVVLKSEMPNQVKKKLTYKQISDFF